MAEQKAHNGGPLCSFYSVKDSGLAIPEMFLIHLQSRCSMRGEAVAQHLPLRCLPLSPALACSWPADIPVPWQPFWYPQMKHLMEVIETTGENLRLFHDTELLPLSTDSFCRNLKAFSFCHSPLVKCKQISLYLHVTMAL